MDFDIGEFYPLRINGAAYFMALPSCSIWQGDPLTLDAMEELKGRSGVSIEELRSILNRYIPEETIPETIESLQTTDSAMSPIY